MRKKMDVFKNENKRKAKKEIKRRPWNMFESLPDAIGKSLLIQEFTKCSPWGKLKFKVINFDLEYIPVYEKKWKEPLPQWRVSLDWVVGLLELIPLILTSINVGIFLYSEKNRKLCECLFIPNRRPSGVTAPKIQIQFQSGFTSRYHRYTLTNEEIWAIRKKLDSKGIRCWAADLSLITTSRFFSQEHFSPTFRPCSIGVSFSESC